MHLLKSEQILSLDCLSSPSLKNMNSKKPENPVQFSLQDFSEQNLSTVPSFSSFENKINEISRDKLRNPFFFNFYSVLLFNLFLQKVLMELPEEFSFLQKFDFIQTGFTKESQIFFIF